MPQFEAHAPWRAATANMYRSFPQRIRRLFLEDGHSSYIRRHQMAELGLRTSVIVTNASSSSSEVKNIVLYDRV